MHMPATSYREWILLLTAFAAGSVDVISFALLGGVFASAMTGNFALLAFYVAKGDSQSAMASVVALVGFAVGCTFGMLQRRGRPASRALSTLLSIEAGLLLLFALYALWIPPVAPARSDHLQILVLAAAMGVQAVIGQTINLTTIVFTATLTKLIGTITDSIANGEGLGLQEVRTQGAVVVCYLFGALTSGTLVVNKIGMVVALPFAAVALAFWIQYRHALRSGDP